METRIHLENPRQIKELCESRKVKQYELADCLGVHRTTIKWYVQTGNMSLDQLKAMAKLFNCTLDHFKFSIVKEYEKKSVAKFHEIEIEGTTLEKQIIKCQRKRQVKCEKCLRGKNELNICDLCSA